MLHLDARIVMHHIFGQEKIDERAMNGACNLLGANNKIDALDNKLEIILLGTLTCCCRFANKVVRGWHQLQVEMDFWRT